MNLSTAASCGSDIIHQAFEEHHQELRAITRRVRRRFEERDWEGIRRDTVEKLELPSRSIADTVDKLRGRLGARLTDRQLWVAMKEAYTQAILGRDDFEIAQTYFNPQGATGVIHELRIADPRRLSISSMAPGRSRFPRLPRRIFWIMI
jgi:isocitrate dehydrogenase kinase/phosphatase